MSLGKSPRSVPVGGPGGTRHLDPSGLKAYAHPLRLEIIRYLTDHGAATATQLAHHLGESSGQTSYHLRQLAKHGLVVDDPARNRGRERWWKATSFQVDAERFTDPGLTAQMQAVVGSLVQGRADALRRWMAAGDAAPREWVEAAMHSQRTLRLTPAEVGEMNDAVDAVLGRYVALSRERDAVPDAVPGVARVRVYYDAFPLPADDA